MIQWFKRKRHERKNRIEKKLKQQILDLEETLEKQITLFEIKTKQYNDFMVESELRARHYRDLLEEEKENNGKLLESRTKQIGALKELNDKLSKQIIDLKNYNSILKQSLGHF